MLNDDDRTAIEGLFSRLDDVERRSPPRDADAERLIARRIERQPGAPYYMAQTILVQERALQDAEQRIRELEQQSRRQDRGSDLFGGLFGGGREDEDRRPRADLEPRRGPWDRGSRDERADDRRQGGGFLAGAAQTALGVTGGILIGNAIASMFGGGTANAAEAPPADPGADHNLDSAGDADPGGFADGGGFGDGGDFDLGGDF